MRTSIFGLVLFGASAASMYADPVRADPAPAFELPRLGGEGTVSLAPLRGKVVLVDFWASWCTPCRKSLPAYAAMRAELGERGFEVVAINLDEQASDATDFLTAQPLALTFARDEGGVVAKAFGLKAMPSSYLIDCDGEIHARLAGYKESELPQLRQRVEAMLGDQCRAP